MYQRGDIVLVPFPFTDLSTTKKRPAIIISNDKVNATGDVIAVMITSQDKKDFLQIEISASDVTPTLPKKSFIRCHKIATLDSGIILHTIGKANISLLEKVKDKIQDIVSDPIDLLQNIEV